MEKLPPSCIRRARALVTGSLRWLGQLLSSPAPSTPCRRGLADLTLLEDRRLLSASALAVDTRLDVVDGNTSSITALLANKGADGHVSLREALLAANNTPGLDSITFAIGSGVQTISLTSALPTITNPVVLDATTQPGFAGTPLIVLDGSLAGAHVPGLDITAGNSTVRGLVIDNFSGDGIVLDVNGGNTIAGNYVGTDVAGSVARANGGFGVDVYSGQFNTIGGAAAGSGNLISGNTQGGIRVTGGSLLVSEDNNVVRVDSQTGAVLATYPTGLANDSVVVGADGSFYVPDYYNNLVNHYDAAGTLLASFGAGHLNEPQDMVFGPDGNLYVGNAYDGAVNKFSPTGTFLGTFVAAGSGGISNAKGMRFGPDGNFYVADYGSDSILRYNGTTGAFLNVFASAGPGVEDLAFGPDGNLYASSYTNGTVYRYRGTDGTLLGAFASGCTTAYGIGFDAAGNLEVACRSTGEIRTYNGSTGAFVRTLVTGLTNPAWFSVAAPGATGGDVIEGNSIGTNAGGSAAVPNLVGVSVDASNSIIGGTSPGAANTIADNSGKGVVLAGGSGNAIETNAIFGNGGLGIDLGNDGVTANTGSENLALPNSGMNFPVFTSVTLSGSTLTVAGHVGTAPGQAVFAGARVEIFKADNSPGGYGQGQTYLGFLTADASGNFSGSLTVSGLSTGDKITGTATDPTNNTSEFAANVSTGSGGLLGTSTTVVSSMNPAVYGQAVTFRITVTGLGLPSLTGTVTLTDGATTLGISSLLLGSATFTTSTLSAGIHSITASYSGDLLFGSSTSSPLTQTVTRAALTVRANSATRGYGQADPAFAVTYAGFVNGDGPGSLGGLLNFATPATLSSSVGAYAVTPGGLFSGNYTISYVAGTLTVTPATLTVAANNAIKGYGQANPTFTDTISGFVNGDTPAVVGGSASLTTAATASSGVGTYAITAAPGSLSAANYTFAFAGGTLTVSPAVLTVTANDAIKGYGQANPAFTDTLTGFVNGDTPAVVTGAASLITAATASSGVGTYAVTATLGSLSAANYTFAFANGTLTVSPAVLTVTANDAIKGYSQANPAFTDTLTGFVNGDTPAVLGGSASLTTAATASSGVGTYAITAAPGTLSAANYTFAFANGTLTVSPVVLTVTASDAIKGYGQANPAFTDTITGFVNGDTPAVVGGSANLTTAATASSGVGTYAITAAPGSLSAANYIFAFANGTLTVGPATLTVTADDAIKGYGQANPAFTDTITGFVNGDTPAAISGSASLTTAATASSGVGTYAITAAPGSLSAANYTFAFANGTLTVSPAPLTVTANNASKPAGQPNPPFAASYSGFVNGDSAASLGGALTFSTPATAASPVGSYPVTPGGVMSSNYRITFVSGTLTVMANPVGITATPASLQTSETGTASSFAVALNNAPSSAVTVNLALSEPGQGSLSQASLTFDATNWNVPQTVTVTGLDDHVVNGDQTYQITGTAVSSDGTYAGLVMTPVTVVNKEADLAGFTVTATSLQTSTTGTTATFGVALTSIPAATVTLTLVTSNPAQGALSQTSLTFNPLNWNVAQSITVTGLDNPIVTGDQSYQITGTASSLDLLYNGQVFAPLPVVNKVADVTSGGAPVGAPAAGPTEVSGGRITGGSGSDLAGDGADGPGNGSLHRGPAHGSTDSPIPPPVGDTSSGALGQAATAQRVSPVGAGTATSPRPAPGGEDFGLVQQINPPDVALVNPPAPARFVPLLPFSPGASGIVRTDPGPFAYAAAPATLPVGDDDYLVEFRTTGRSSRALMPPAPDSVTTQVVLQTVRASELATAGLLAGQDLFIATTSEGVVRPLSPQALGSTLFSSGAFAEAAVDSAPSLSSPADELGVGGGVFRQLAPWGRSPEERLKQTTAYTDAAEPEAEPAALAVTALTATAGYVLLNTRATSWLLGALAARPLWNRLDPLEILFAWEDQHGPADDEEESLLSLVE